MEAEYYEKGYPYLLRDIKGLLGNLEYGGASNRPHGVLFRPLGDMAPV